MTCRYSHEYVGLAKKRMDTEVIVHSDCLQ